MSPEEVQRASEPFYTTRAEGTGLGLTVVQRVAQAHDAVMEIRSVLGDGTTVTVVFPRSDFASDRHGS
jgi:signal transduction histidine kinase